MIFGRDSLESADDLLRVNPAVSESVILRLAQLQGVDFNSDNAEEPGRILHQHMQLYINGKRIPKSAEDQMHRLAERWGGNEIGFTYYGALDSTPLFARLIARHCLVHGSSILRSELTNRRGKRLTVRDSFVQALGWITDHIDSSEINLLEFRRLNNNHIIAQSWRDSGSGFIHEDGSQANFDGFIAPLEVQGYAYDALKLAAQLLRSETGVSSELTEKWESYAERLQANILARFWINERSQFGMGIDRDDQWQPRLIKTAASSQGLLLDSRLLLDLPEEERQTYITGVLDALYGSEFLTEIGIRCRAVKDADLVPFADYHGSQAVWAKESYDFAKGLRRQGFSKLADDMEARILNMVNVAGANYEFLYVNKAGEVDYQPKPYYPGMVVDEVIKGTNIPDEGQAWTVSAVLAIKRGERPQHTASLQNWVLEKQKLIQSLVPQTAILNKSEALRARESAKRFAIDIEAGKEADRRYNPHWWENTPDVS
jgi:glycogen debranching enzyme